jgi:RNA polymerase sigma-70 factor (ECF subfamily)
MPALDDALGDQLFRGGASPEMELLRAKYHPEFETATTLGLQRLTSRQRAVLRLYLLAGLNIDEIGKIYTVHRSTVARWISGAEKAVFDAVRSYMNERHQLTTSDVTNLAGLVRSQLQLSLRRLLGDDTRQR